MGIYRGSSVTRRRRRGRRLWAVEGLEDRLLLSGSPTVYTVDLTSDTGAGSGTTGDLLYAIDQANANTNPAGSVIQFAPSVFKASESPVNPVAPAGITLTKPLDLTGTIGPIVIDGPGENAIVLYGNNAVTAFEINSGVTATISGFLIESCFSSGNGGGVLNEGNLTLSSCEISDSTAMGSGGGIQNDGSMTANGCFLQYENAEAATGYGGGIANDGTLALNGCDISDCRVSGANGSGGGVYNAGSLSVQGGEIAANLVFDGSGGGLYNNGTATISYTTFVANWSASGGSGGGVYNAGNLTLAYSAIRSNSTAQYGGGISNELDMSISYCTISGNTASTQGGGIDNGSTLQAVNVTIAANTVNTTDGGGGLFAGSTATTLINTIVAQNNQIVAMIPSPDDIAGTVSPSSSNNLIGTGGAGGLTSGSGDNQVGVANPGLGALANNGGPTETMALLPGSPAIDAGINFSAGGTTDQRGLGFASTYNGGIDIGAYELQPAMVTAVTVEWGRAGYAALQTADDGLRLLPAGRNTDLPWLGINELLITFNEPETLTAADVTISSRRGIKYGPVTVTSASTCCPEGFTYDVNLARPIEKADRVTITIAGAELVSYTRRLDVLPGDFNDSGVVTSQDVTAIRNEWKGTHGAQPTIFGDILGDGTVNASDYKAAKQRIGSRLPKLPKTGGKTPTAAIARQPSISGIGARRVVRSAVGPLRVGVGFPSGGFRARGQARQMQPT